MTLPRKIKTTTKTGRFQSSTPNVTNISKPVVWNTMRIPKVIWVVIEIIKDGGLSVWVATSKKIAEDIVIRIVKDYATDWLFAARRCQVAQNVINQIKKYNAGKCTIESVLNEWRAADGYINDIVIQSSGIETQLQKDKVLAPKAKKVRRVT